MFNANSVHLSSDVLYALEPLDPVIANGIAEALIYWSSPVVYFHHVYEYWNLPPTIFSGISPFVHRRLTGLGLVSSTESLSNHWRDLCYNAGLFPNAWGTTWTQVVQSLGRVLGMLVCLSTAFIAGRLYAVSRQRGQFRGFFLSSILFYLFFTWFQFSAFAQPIIEWGLILGLVGGRFFRQFDVNAVLGGLPARHPRHVSAKSVHAVR